MSQVTVILNNMIVRMVADGDILDVERGEVGNIVSEFYEEEHVLEDPSGHICDD